MCPSCHASGRKIPKSIPCPLLKLACAPFCDLCFNLSMRDSEAMRSTSRMQSSWGRTRPSSNTRKRQQSHLRAWHPCSQQMQVLLQAFSAIQMQSNLLAAWKAVIKMPLGLFQWGDKTCSVCLAQAFPAHVVDGSMTSTVSCTGHSGNYLAGWPTASSQCSGGISFGRRSCSAGSKSANAFCRHPAASEPKVQHELCLGIFAAALGSR